MPFPMINLLLIFCLPISALAENFTWTMQSSSVWKMEARNQENFESYLQSQMRNLLLRLPHTYWPEIDKASQLQEIFQTAMVSVSPFYKNRKLQCGFIEKMLQVAAPATRARIEALWENGKHCTPFDVSSMERNDWVLSWIDILWNGQWIPLNGNLLGLEDLLRTKNPNYRRPGIFLAPKVEFDGFGWGYSEDSLALFQSTPILKRFQEIGAKFDPNGKEPFLLLGQEVAKMLYAQPYGGAGAVHLSSEIYVSPTIAPADLVEFLVHEYGHVLRGESRQDFSWSPEERILTYRQDHAMSEGFAEGFARLVLQEFYTIYPELEFFHLGKLIVFGALKDKDPHFVGAGANWQIFQQRNPASLSDLMKFARAENFPDFLQQYGLPGLVPMEPEQKFSVPVSLPDEIILQNR